MLCLLDIHEKLSSVEIINAYIAIKKEYRAGTNKAKRIWNVKFMKYSDNMCKTNMCVVKSAVGGKVNQPVPPKITSEISNKYFVESVERVHLSNILFLGGW